MIPLTLSATAIEVANTCLRRFKAEFVDRSKGLQNDAAVLGSTCHFALENYVTDVYVDRVKPPTLEHLLSYYKLEYDDKFEDREQPQYLDGIQMLTKWWKRQGDMLDDPNRTVVMVEQKMNFPVKPNGPDGNKIEIPFNYIWDRFDKIGDDEYEVVDYKSNRLALNLDDLRGLPQARAYSLAARSYLKSQGIEPKRIWVRFDYLRHESIATVFTRDDDIKTFNEIKKVAQKLIDAGDKAPPTLNTKCNFCPVKATCPSLASNVLIMGIMSLSPDEQLDRLAELQFQAGGVKNAIDELEKMILARAKEDDTNEYMTPANKVMITVSTRRSIDAESVMQVIGEKRFNLYGGPNISMGKFDELLKDPTLEPEQVAKLKRLVGQRYGSPSVKIKPRGFTETEDDS